MMGGKAAARPFLTCGATLWLALLIGGFTGRYLPVGDALAVIRPQLAVVLILWAVALWWVGARRLARIGWGVAAVCLLSVGPAFLTRDAPCEGPCLTLYQKNLLSKAWPRYELADEIIASGAEIVTLQEVSAHNRRFMAKLFRHYPATVICPFRPEQEVAVLTSLPVVEGSSFCLPGAGLAGVAVVLANGKRAWALSVHLEWPFPFDQFHQARRIAERIADLEGPVLIGGDFNMVPWGASVARIRQAAGNRRLGGYWTTYRPGGLAWPLPIDTVLVPAPVRGTVELRPRIGSDHAGVLARMTLP